jgi:hypothetical protein
MSKAIPCRGREAGRFASQKMAGEVGRAASRQRCLSPSKARNSRTTRRPREKGSKPKAISSTKSENREITASKTLIPETHNHIPSSACQYLGGRLYATAQLPSEGRNEAGAPENAVPGNRRSREPDSTLTAVRQLHSPKHRWHKFSTDAGIMTRVNPLEKNAQTPI